jgi:hypothetical protein
MIEVRDLGTHPSAVLAKMRMAPGPAPRSPGPGAVARKGRPIVATTCPGLGAVPRAASTLEAARKLLEPLSVLSDEEIVEDADLLAYYAGEITEASESLLRWSTRVVRVANEAREAELAKRRDDSPKGEERAKVLREFVTAEAFQEVIQGIGGWNPTFDGMPVEKALARLVEGVDLDEAGALGQSQFNELWPNDEGDWTADETAEHDQAKRDGHRLAGEILNALAGASEWLTAAAGRQQELAKAGNDA